MITKEAIEQLQQSRHLPETRTINGIDYLIVPNNMSVAKQNPATPIELTIYTLGGIVEYLKNSNSLEELWERDQEAKYLIHIENFSTVRVLSPLEPTHMTRRNFIKAIARPNQFRLEQYMSTEQFIIAVMSSFTETENRERLLSFISNVKAANTREEADQGVAQTVTVQKTVATLGLADVPNPVELQPYVTFPEITQPLRSYVFRIKQQKPEEPITCGLFPIESSVWESKTCEKIREYFEDVGSQADMHATIIS